MAERLHLGYDLFDAIMTAREKQAAHMARKIISLGHDVCIMGKAFKPGIDQDAGSPAILLGHYIEGMGRRIYYDGHTKEVTTPLTYVMHDHKRFEDFVFNYGSVIFDPFRKMSLTSDLTQRGIQVYNYGNSEISPAIGRDDPGRV